MRKDIIDKFEVLYSANIRYFRTFILSLLAFVGLVVANFAILFNSVKKNIIISGENNITQFAMETNYFLVESVDAVKLAAYEVDRMMDKGSSSDDIHEYLVNQMDAFTGTLDKSFAGSYGVFDGEYIDSIDWVPEEDYVPEERDWYIDAVEAGGDVALVAPYLDAYSGNMMFSVSEMLSDGKSVVSLDISLEGIQKLVEEEVSSDRGDFALILDSDGMVVAHSNSSKLGKEYLNEKGTFGNTVAKKLFETKDKHFEVQYEGIRYIVFSSQIGDDWYALRVVDENNLYGPLKNLYFIFFVFLAMFFIIVISIFIKISQRQSETQNLNVQLQSIASIYITAYLIDINTDTFEEIVSTDDIRAMLLDGQDHARDTLKVIMELKTGEQSKKNILKFIDFSTLDERLADMNTITQEYINEKNKWCRARFVIVDRNSDGSIHRVMWMVEVIDEEKRQRDNLQYLSETDRMTGILNRGGGEAKVREMLENGRGGMFCLMDADKFKSINDNYGHGVGDKVLIAIADCLKKSFRGNDIVLRLGGDEFAAFAPTVMSDKVGKPIIDRFFDNIDNIEIPELGERKINISMGVAFYKPGDTYSFDELYKRADSGTYLSKKHEGNYVTFFEEKDD